MGGSASSARAKANFRFMPPEYFWKNKNGLIYHDICMKTYAKTYAETENRFLMVGRMV
jgi:hypothetical protein